MKKTTYILIALVVAGLLFAFTLPMILFSPKNTGIADPFDLPEPLINLPMPTFRHLVLHDTEWNHTGWTPCTNMLLTIEESDSADEPYLTANEQLAQFIKFTTDNDTLNLKINVPEDIANQYCSKIDAVIARLQITLPRRTLTSLDMAGIFPTGFTCRNIESDTLRMTLGHNNIFESCHINFFADKANADMGIRGQIFFNNHTVIDNCTLSHLETATIECDDSSYVSSMTIVPCDFPYEHQFTCVYLANTDIRNLDIKDNGNNSVYIHYGPRALRSLHASQQ